MKMEPVDIKYAILEGDIGAISIDTSIFDAAKLGLEFGVLKRVQQFKDSNTGLVFSDIVLSELKAHLLKEATAAQATLKNATKGLGDSWGLTVAQREAILENAFGKSTPAEIVKSRLKNYLDATGAQLAKAGDRVDVAELVRMYFKHTPPFADKDSKKNEFPDALALLALESWADENDTKMLVVTKDGDWASYCETSNRLIAIDDLGAALGLFQQDESRFICRSLDEQLKGKDPADILSEINGALKHNEDAIEVIAEADSQFNWEMSMSEGVIEEVDSECLSELEPLEYDGEELVARMYVPVPIEVTAYFDFEKWDSMDREYMPMGSGTASQKTNVEAEVIITFHGDLPDHPKIADIEVKFSHARVEFADIEPDWMSNPDNFGD